MDIKKSFIENEATYSIEDDKCINIGSTKENDIYLKNIDESFKVLLEDFKIYNYDNKVLNINGKYIDDEIIVLNEGDCILLKDLQLVMHENYIIFKGNMENYQCDLEEYIIKDKLFQGFPIYKRSPRLIKRTPMDEIEILMPPSELKNKKGYLAKIIIPPIVMLIMTIIICIINPRGIYIIVTIVGTIMSTIFSITSYFSEKKEIIRKNINREKVYNEYLLKLRKKLHVLRKQQIDALTYNNLDIKKIYELINNYSSRIYERNSNEDDFLNICIGKSTMRSDYTIKIQNNELEFHKDELVHNAIEVYDEFKNIEDMPVMVDMKKAHLGIVGEKKNIHEQLKLIFSQLTFEHSYHDIEIVFLYDEKYKDNFSFLRWYPHFKIKSINITGIVNNERIRDQVLGSLNQILKDRKIRKEEKLKESRFTPHLVFVIEEPKLIINHSIMEYLNKELLELGGSIIYTSNMKANLPEDIKTIFILEDSNIGTLLLEEGVMINKTISLNHVGNIDLERMARNLAAIEHEKGMTSQIPKSITFFEMYNIKSPKELNIIDRWNNNSSYKSLAVPLGVRSENDYVELNLHEKAHGPHGLIAGTTGSGKSEIIQSYILSLAVNFHPYEVGFLLIDYKGGGMAGLFKNLPHLLGTITNLDGSESMRAMASIKSELSRRQYIFSENNVNHINQYNKLFKTGKVQEPLPHLFIISDEFAELKKEQPEFMSELVTAARIGRSLGIHLILATQKPTGVVDEQIWSNSKFKLALKVQNESDSNEVLKTPDAANITLPGRAYLQVGNNEIYELFQSAWSGASYSENKEKNNVDNRIYLINELGQRTLLNKDLSEECESSTSNLTELDVVIEQVRETFNNMNLPYVKKPWLSPLENEIITPYINEEFNLDLDYIDDLDTDVSIGVVDIPEKQSQIQYNIDFIKDGNIAIFSSSGFGKSTTLMTIALSLAVKNSPKLLNYYILDFGNSSLIQLKNLPHTADYLTFDDTEKVNKLISILEVEIKNRKLLFGEKSALNFSMYNNISEEKLPVIVVFIDNYDVIKEIGYEVEEFITKLSRDGIGVGIYLTITASRANSVKYAVLNNFKNKFTHYMFDYTEITTIMGRSKYILKEIPGRALVKLDSVNLMQVYKSVEAKDDMEYTTKISLLINKIKDLYTGPKVLGIPVLPEILTDNMLMEYENRIRDKELLPIGLDIENVKLQYMDLSMGNNIIVGPAQSGKTNLLRVILKDLCKNASKIYLFDSYDMEMLEVSKLYDNIQYVDSKEQTLNFIEELVKEINNRKLKFDEQREKDEVITPKKFFAALETVYIVIDDCDKFIETLKATKNLEVEKIILEAIGVGIKIIGTTTPTKLRGFDGISKLLKESMNGVILGNPNEQSILMGGHVRVKKVDLGYGFIYKKGELVQVKIALEKK